MFVKTGAQEQLKETARKNFLEHSLRNFLEEAKDLGISRQELITIINKEEERG
jgi:DNA-binding transcriptional regulator YhcF (GntR family)